MSTRTAWTGGARINAPADVQRVLSQINDAAVHRDRTTALAHAVQTADDAAALDGGADRVLPAAPAIAEQLLPWSGGFRRGATVAVVGSSSLLLAIIAGAMNDTTSWAAVVGMPTLGMLAAAEAGVDLDRIGLVPQAGPDWPKIVAALLDGLDLVVVAPPPDTAAGTVRSLMARARERQSVLITTRPWPGCDLVIERTSLAWTGLGQGHGRLRQQTATLRATGRGRAARPREASLHLQPVVTSPAPAAPVLLRVPPPEPDQPDQPEMAETAEAGAVVELQPVSRPVDPWADLSQQARSEPRLRRR